MREDLVLKLAERFEGKEIYEYNGETYVMYGVDIVHYESLQEARDEIKMIHRDKGLYTFLGN
ncbi:MAG: hypothetical protein J6J36_06850 [Clostridia bacterium]|nr:hypothetical protein [Clostridia bacterium]